MFKDEIARVREWRGSEEMGKKEVGSSLPTWKNFTSDIFFLMADEKNKKGKESTSRPCD